MLIFDPFKRNFDQIKVLRLQKLFLYAVPYPENTLGTILQQPVIRFPTQINQKQQALFCLIC